jgi:hypothetical protein
MGKQHLSMCVKCGGPRRLIAGELCSRCRKHPMDVCACGSPKKVSSASCRPCHLRLINEDPDRKAKFYKSRWEGRLKYVSVRHRRTSVYGLGPGDYERMYERQDGCCALCGAARAVLSVDHDHETGRVRGLLCNRCNLFVGQLEMAMRADLLRDALAYVTDRARMEV